MVAEAGLRFFPVMSGLHALPVSKESPQALVINVVGSDFDQIE